MVMVPSELILEKVSDQYEKYRDSMLKFGLARTIDSILGSDLESRLTGPRVHYYFVDLPDKAYEALASEDNERLQKRDNCYVISTQLGDNVFVSPMGDDYEYDRNMMSIRVGNSKQRAFYNWNHYAGIRTL